jgi:hypothetical protein
MGDGTVQTVGPVVFSEKEVAIVQTGGLLSSTSML